MTLRLLSLLIACTAATAAQADEIWRYTVLFQGVPGGSQVTTAGNDGRRVVEFTYRQNGRGPDVHEEITLDRDGTQLRHTLAGKATFGAPIDESFERRDSAAQWRSTADQGSAATSRPAVYYPISESSAEILAVLVRAALRQPGQRIAALPSGELVVKRLREARLQAQGRRQAVQLYAINGLDFSPQYVWLTQERNPRLFAWVYPGWIQIVEAGWESQAVELERRQVEAQTEQIRALTIALTHRLPDPLVIRNARVFDAEHARLTGPSDVYLHRGRIAAVYPAPSAPREAAATIDAAGRTLLPALFDMHSHEDAWRGLRQIAGGVTTVRDMGADNAVLAELIARIEAGQSLGARIVPAGFIEGKSEHQASGGFAADSIDEVKRAIDWYAQRGFPQVKLYNSFRREWVAETTRYAHERGLRVSGHVPAFMRAEEVVAMGYDELQHINQVLLNFLVGPKDDTRTLARFHLVMEKAHALDLDDAAARRFIALMRQRGTVVDSTAATFEDMKQLPGEPHPAYAAIIDHLPATVRRGLHMTSFDITDANVGRYRASYDKMLEMIGRMHRAGIPLVAGTDAIAGFALHRELELYVRAGIPPAEVLRIATWNGAMYTRTLDRLGSITPGKLADLILVDGDPTANISNIRRISLVMKEGVAYYPSEIYPELGVKPFAPPVTVARTVAP